jgi:uncharacterized membrane protein
MRRKQGLIVALAALKPYKGAVQHTSFRPEAEEELRRILSKRISTTDERRKTPDE